MVIKAEDAEYLAPFIENKAAVFSSEKSLAADEEAKESRNHQNLRIESRTELEDQDDSCSRKMHQDETSKGFSVISSVDDTREALITEETDEGSNQRSAKADLSLIPNKATHRKNKGLLHRIRPRSSKANYARSNFSGSVVTSLSNNDSFVTEIVKSKSLDQMTKNLTIPMNEFDDKNKPSFERPPLYQRTDVSSRCVSIDDPASIARNENLSVDDGNTSISIMASVSDCEVAIENCEGPQNDERSKNASLVDCDSGRSTVVTKRHGLFGQKHRSNKSMIRNEEPDTHSKPPLSTTMLVKEPTNKIQNYDEKERTHQKDNANYKSQHKSDHDVKDVSLMDCATESSSVASRKRGIFRRNRNCRSIETNEGIDAQRVPASSRGLSLVDCATGNSSVATEKCSVLGRNHQMKKKFESSDVQSLPPSSQGGRLVDCATDNSSVVTEKGGLFGHYRRPRKVATENGNSCAHSVPPLSTNMSSKDGLMLQKKYDHDEKSVSLADDLTESSSVVAGKRMAYRQFYPIVPTKLLESHDPLQRSRQESNTRNESGQEFPANPALQLKSDDASDLQKGTPDIRFPPNQSKHLTSEAASSNQAAAVQGVEGASYSFAKTIDHEHDPKRSSVSPVSEAFKYATSQAGVLKAKFEEKERNIMDLACDRKDQDVPSESLNDKLQSNKMPMAGGVSGLTSSVGLEWVECDEFGKGKRHYQPTGYRIYDAIQLLRTRFACESYSDNTINKEKRYFQDEYAAEQKNQWLVSGNQTQKQCHQDPAKDTVAALRSLRHQLTCNIDEEVPAIDEYFERKGYHSVSSNSNRNMMHSGGSLIDFEHSTKTGSDRHITDNSEESKFFEPVTEVEIRNITSSSKQATRNVISASQASEDSGIVNEERISTVSRRSSFEIPMVRDSASCASGKRGYAIGALNGLRRKKKGNHSDEASQMMSSFFSGDTPVINNHAKTRSRLHSAQGLRGNLDKQSRNWKGDAQSARVFTGEGIKIVDEGGYLRRLIEQPLEEEEEVSEEEDDDENEIEEQSVWTAAPKLSRGNKTPTFNTGPKQLRDVQLVLSASSTLELPKHKRNTVIRLATVPGNISYQKVTDTLHKHQSDFERKQTQKQLQLAKRAVISGQYMDSLDPCFRVFDPALDACDNFCTQNRSEESDDECSIASISVSDEKPRGDFQQAGKETRFWPFKSRSRVIKAPTRL
ncbi:hypothetical protein FisN_2Hh599 [Fistulifera solaris]|uniref:Uncharacterized protein n=1 Tax=Fistulifera solaris TaxID=1519565 RepID=A0A1Z5JIQ3_FISSO|nr:hypothetical protein FisN_2Hh599 [Fistulifera solaris]|eukprot:GAX13722.1 hypothetical protein FisN_2Hh599 [Fistulifera solaris]